MTYSVRWLGLAMSAAFVLGTTSCSGPRNIVGQGEGVNAANLPENMQADYALFAQRCSKCHSLSRAFNSGDNDDVFWARYVARMRRQPGSGISPSEEAPILRFLHYYSEQTRAERSAKKEGSK